MRGVRPHPDEVPWLGVSTFGFVFLRSRTAGVAARVPAGRFSTVVFKVLVRDQSAEVGVEKESL